MSKIQEIAVAIREVTRVIQLAEDRVALLKSYGEDKMVEGGTGLFALITNAERVSKDAHNLRSAFELEMATHVPETVADVLAQVLVVADYFHCWALDSGNDGERLVRLMLGRIVEGLRLMAGENATAASEVYGSDTWHWGHQVKEVADPLPGPIVNRTYGKPFCVA